MKSRKDVCFPALFDWLERNCITHRKFADDIGVTESVVCYWFQGKRQPQYDSVCRILTYTGMTFEEFKEGNHE